MLQPDRSRPLLVLVLAMALALVTSSMVVAQDDEVTPIDEATALLASEINTIEVVDRYGPSVVAVHVSAAGETMLPFQEFLGPGGEGPIQESAGSGFVMNPRARRTW